MNVQENEFQFILATQITNIDILDNLSKECIAILLYKENWWIEIWKPNFYNSYKQYYIDNGWIGVKTNDILEAISYLKEFYINNA
jgi:hypothetical protein